MGPAIHNSRKNGRDSEDRRGFLKSAIGGLTALMTLLAAGVSIVSLLPAGKQGRKEAFLPIVDEDDAPRRGAGEFLFSYRRGDRDVTGKILLVHTTEGLIALSPSCTHLGCFVVWNEEEGEFRCPCHGGRYDPSGRNIEGPPPRPLQRFPLRRKDGKIMVRVPI